MREICLVRLDKTRPALVLTREAARAAMTKVTVAPITTTIKGLVQRGQVGPDNGLDQDCVVALDNVITVPVEPAGPQRRVSQRPTGVRARPRCGSGLRPRTTPSRMTPRRADSRAARLPQSVGVRTVPRERRAVNLGRRI